MARLFPTRWRALTAALFCVSVSAASQADVLPDEVNKNSLLSISLDEDDTVTLIRCRSKSCSLRAYDDTGSFTTPFAVMVMHPRGDKVHYAAKTPDGDSLEFTHPAHYDTVFRGYYDATLTTKRAALR